MSGRRDCNLSTFRAITGTIDGGVRMRGCQQGRQAASGRHRADINPRQDRGGAQ